MLQRIKKILPIIVLLLGATAIIGVGYLIYRKPYDEADNRNEYEESLIDDYLKDTPTDESGNKPDEDEREMEYPYSDIDDYTFQGSIDCILVIDKINLKKAIIRGNTSSDNNFNLDKYYFVTADLTSTLDGNYIIYGHSSQVYGHSFNRLDELCINDTFYIIQGQKKYNYQVEAVDRALRSESAPYFPALEKRVTLVSCEKYLHSGYTQKRVIIVRSVQTDIETLQ